MELDICQGVRNTQPPHECDVVGQRRLLSDLPGACARGELVLHYQPKLDLATATICGAEALLRWNHPVFGMLCPRHFIPAAEKSGLILEIGNWALRRATEFAVRVNSFLGNPLTLSVNVSPLQFHCQDMLRVMQAILRDTGADPRWLTLELTENRAMGESPRTIATLHGMRNSGLGLSIDDFGTGYSNLCYLVALPVNELKIDRSFVSGVHLSRSKRLIIGAIILLCQQLGVSVTGEGMETGDEVAALRELGCGHGQGYFFHKPLPGSDFEALVR